MFPKIIKLILAAFTVAFSVYQFVEGAIGNGIFLLLIAGMFILLYYKNEFILLAFLQLRKQNFEGTNTTKPFDALQKDCHHKNTQNSSVENRANDVDQLN